MALALQKSSNIQTVTILFSSTGFVEVLNDVPTNSSECVSDTRWFFCVCRFWKLILVHSSPRYVSSKGIFDIHLSQSCSKRIHIWNNGNNPYILIYLPLGNMTEGCMQEIIFYINLSTVTDVTSLPV